MRVVGLDLSLTATGVAADCDIPNRGAFTLTTKLRGMERLAWLRDAVMRTVPADLVVIEGYSMGTARQTSHAHGLGELGGVIRLALHEAGVGYIDVPPAALKKYACGKGNANKQEMLGAAIRRLDYEGNDHNEADALWLQAMGLDALGDPVVELPKEHRVALAKIAWPGLQASIAAHPAGAVS